MSQQMWYDRQGQPIDIARAHELLGDNTYRRVALTRITSTLSDDVKVDVSTVWLGWDRNGSSCPPILFETMIIGRDKGRRAEKQRWHTEAEACAGHAEIVATLAADVPDGQIVHIVVASQP